MPLIPPVITVSEKTFELWQTLADFPASETEAALKHLQEWIAKEIDADNVIWIGCVRILRGAPAKTDPFLGWRLRTRAALHPDPLPYRHQYAEYYESAHYGKLTPTYYERSHEAQKDDHIGIGSRAAMASAGRFRVIELRASVYFDFTEFEKSAHYQRYYLDTGITDRCTIGFPVAPDLESFFLIDRYEGRSGPVHFSHAEAMRAGDAVRGVPLLHRRLFLNNGLIASDKPLSPLQREILQGLLTGRSENEIAVSLGRNAATLHKHVLALYTLFGVKSRPAFMALWLEGYSSQSMPARTRVGGSFE